MYDNVDTPSLVTKDGVQPPDTQLPKAQPNHPLPGGDVLSVEQPPLPPTCLCSGDQVCNKCLHPAQMAAVVCSVRKENQALKFHILSLEECVKALENRVVALKDNNQNHTTGPRGNSKPKAVNRPSTGMTNNSRPQPKSSGYAGARVFRYKSYAQAASAEDNGKARHTAEVTHTSGAHLQGNMIKLEAMWVMMQASG